MYTDGYHPFAADKGQPLMSKKLPVCPFFVLDSYKLKEDSKLWEMELGLSNLLLKQALLVN